MGKNESKFRSGPEHVWYITNTTGKQPKLIQSVMEAIVHLKEAGGSTQSSIVEYLQGVINYKNISPRPRALAMQVKKALKYGIINDLILYKSGKFLLALKAKDFAILKTFPPYDPIFGASEKKSVIYPWMILKCKSINKDKEGKRKYSSKSATKRRYRCKFPSVKK